MGKFPSPDGRAAISLPLLGRCRKISSISRVTYLEANLARWVRQEVKDKTTIDSVAAVLTCLESEAVCRVAITPHLSTRLAVPQLPVAAHACTSFSARACSARLGGNHSLLRTNSCKINANLMLWID